MWRSTAAASFMFVATVASADDKSACLDGKDHDQRINSCSAIIERNPKDAVAFYNRGEAYELKGEIDRAISDYTKAIVADPNYAPAYDHRGRAYVSKGDYVRAVDDVTRASELTHKVQPNAAVVLPKSAVVPPKPAAVQPKPAAAQPKPAAVQPKPAAVEATPLKQKEEGTSVLPVPGKSAIPENPSTLGKASVAGTLPEDGKASKVESPGESTWLGRWPTWMPR